MQLHYGKAPINYIDGVPAHLAGEWPGLKSSKFHSYRKIIYPLSQGVIFNEKEPPLLPKKNYLDLLVHHQNGNFVHVVNLFQK